MNLKKIINLPVYTESKEYLGLLIDLDIDLDTGKIEKYFVKNKNFLKNLWQGCLIIVPSQIVAISEKKIIVKDNINKVEDLVSSPVK
jgi:sporulation protein YlmC with PRC-barrel domain